MQWDPAWRPDRPPAGRWAELLAVGEGRRVAAAHLGAGTAHWPQDALWLGEWEAELLAFPNARHDDQTDVFAYAALDVTGSASIDPGRLAQALAASD